MSHRVRLIFIAVAIFAWTGLILSRLYVLQHEKADDYRERAERQHQSRIKLNPKRGTIWDADGTILAINVDVPSVYAVPDEIENPEEVAKALLPLLNMSREDLLSALTRGSSFVWLERKITHELKERIAALQLPGISFVTESKRIYPYGNLASHVLGFVGIDNDGLAGVEYSYDSYLKGNPGTMIGVRGAKRGYHFSSGKVLKPPTGGNDVRLTLDATLQFIAEEELERQVLATESESGTVVMIDPDTGAILALASYPDYDPNNLGDSTPTARKNRAVVDAYEPGSTFKLVTAAAAFEAGVVSPDQTFDCEMGSITIGRRTIRDHKPFGVMTFREVIEHSSNVGTIKVGELLGEKRLWTMADAFGYGHGTGVDLPGENPGILRPLDRWTSTSYASISIGQEVSGNPLQIVINAAVVANGGYWVRPHIVSSVIDKDGKLLYSGQPESRKIVSDDTIHILRDFTRGVVLTGGGMEAAIDGIPVAGKTGTGEIAVAGRGYVPGAYLASFDGYFPYDNPRIAMLCMLVRPKGEYYGGQVAAPLFAAIAGRAATALELDREGQRRVTAESVIVGDLTRLAVREDRPASPRSVPSYEHALVMPDLRGMNLREAVARLAELGVVPSVRGRGIVTAQTPEPGETVGTAATLFAGGTGVAN